MKKRKHLPILVLLWALAAQAQDFPAYWRQYANGTDTFNFHRAANGRASADSVPYAADYTVVVVYSAKSDTAERTLWSVGYAGGARRGLTTRRILSDSTAVTYAAENLRGPVINTLQQSAPGHGGPCLPLLAVGDSAGGAKMAELMYFDRRLGMGSLRRVQSYLAAKYGVTLGPADYIDGHGTVFWDYTAGRDYHHRVTAVGIDSTYGLAQTVSRSEHDGAAVTLFSTELGQGRFVACGDNGEPLTLATDPATGIDVLRREWMLRATNMAGRTFGIAFDGGMVPGADTLTLILDGAPRKADSVVGGTHYFNRLTVDADSALFTFAAVIPGEASALRGGASPDNVAARDGERVSVYPNPTTGRYRIDVSGATEVEVVVYTLLGVPVASHVGRAGTTHSFEGVLPAGASYYVTVTTPGGRQTTKLVVE